MIFGGTQQQNQRVALLALAVYAGFDILLPLVHVPLRGLSPIALAALAFVPTAIFMFLQLWLSRGLVGLRPSPAVCLAVMALSVGLWFLLLMSLPWVIKVGHFHPHQRPTLPQQFLLTLRQFLSDFSITLACTFFGILLSRIVREPGILLPAALISMPIDYIGAMTPVGFTQNVVTQHPEIVRAVSVHVPTIRGLSLYPLIGPGDALFMAFFFAVVLRLGLNDRGTFWWMYGLLTVAMLLVLALPHFNVAALVPMGLAVLVANRAAFRLKRSEVFAVLYAGLMVLALVVAFYFYSHAHFFRH